MQHARLHRPVGDQVAAALLRNRDEPFLVRLLIDVGEVYVVELHPSDLLQLLLDPSARFQGVFEAQADIVLLIGSVWKHQLEQAGNGLAHRDRIALIEVVAQLEVPIDGVGEASLAHFAHELGQVVCDQTVASGEELRPHLRNFPPGDVRVEAVEERAVDHGLGEGRQ